MAITYDPLWRMLNNLNISKMEFAKSINISNATLAKFSKNETVALTIIEKICEKYNCRVEHILRYVPDKERTLIPIEELTVGTIVISSWHILNSSPMRVRKDGILKKQPCVILRRHVDIHPMSCIKPSFLVAPLLFESVSDTILDIGFKDLKLYNKVIERGFIQIGRIGYALHNNCETIIGSMPNEYMKESFELLEKVNTIVNFH